MTMETPVAAGGAAIAEPDMELRRGPGLTDDRVTISYKEIDNYRRTIRKYAIVYYPPSRNGVPGGDRRHPTLLPAEKHQKWFGQGYRPVDWEQPPTPEPRRWLPSMIEAAISEGKPIPEEMRPMGYGGPTFKLQRPEAGEPGTGPEIFYCEVEGCERFFDGERGLSMHMRREHAE